MAVTTDNALLVMVTDAEPDFEESAADVAVTVTDPGEIAGEKYSPGVQGTVMPLLGQTNPMVELPPTTGPPVDPVTDQVTPLFGVPCTFALNWYVSPVAIAAVVGSTVTVIPEVMFTVAVPNAFRSCVLTATTKNGLVGGAPAGAV